MADGGGIGAWTRRKEDRRLLVGAGCYADDVTLPGQVWAVVVRSPHAHARILGFQTAEALAMAGVVAVLTGNDAMADGLTRPLQHNWTPSHPPDIALANRDGSPTFISPHLPLPREKVRFVGETVALVIAETLAAARDAAEKVVIGYEVLAATVAPSDAVASGATQLWGGAPGNVAIDADVGDEAATASAFAGAAHVVRLSTRIQRITGVHMEPRAVTAAFDAETGRYTVYTGSGGVVRLKRELADALGVPGERVRVVIRDVGGNFGTRNSVYPEFVLVAWAARRLKRPVKWRAERAEAFLSDYQARDLQADAELALDSDGTFLAMRGGLISNVGAHTVAFIALFKGTALMTGVYDIPAARFRARAALSNTPPTHPYRSTGRPESMFILERLIDKAARQFGFDRIALRHRNLISAGSMPYTNAIGVVYDSGDYALAMNRALELADYNGFAARREEARARGLHRGIGISNYIEITSGNPRERVEVMVFPDNIVEVTIGTLSSGQGHETSFAQLVVSWLGVELDQVRLVTGDTDVLPVGGGSHSGRSMRLAGVVIGKATEQIIEKGRHVAAQMLEVSEADVGFSAGKFGVTGTDRFVNLFEVAGVERLAAAVDETVMQAGFPYGCHVCEVEVDAETGLVRLVRHTGVDDVGRAINPMILHGQAHGAIAQGVGQALWEMCAYDDVNGQLLSGSFMDYAMPRADGLPSFVTEVSEVPSPTNPLGIRAGGEGGTTPALAVVTNAIVDALSEFGVQHMEMPATPERVWRAIEYRKRFS